MKILKDGNLKERKFICDICGCEFIANSTEYYATNAGHQILWYVSTCPCCHNDTYSSEPWEEENEASI